MNTKRMIAVLAVIAMTMAVSVIIPGDDGSAEDGKEIVYMHGEVTSKLTGTTEQKVIIDQDMTIKTGGQVVIEGDLEILAGITVTIESGTQYTTGMEPDTISYGIFNIFGDATVNGDIVSKSADGLYIEPKDNCTVIINGNISALGDTSGIIAYDVIHMYAEPEEVGDKDIIVNGTITVGTNADAYFNCVLFTENSKLIVLGEVEGYIFFAGYAYFDGSISADLLAFEINLVSANAVVDIVSIACEKGHRMFIRDLYMHTCTYGGVDYYVEGYPYYASDKASFAIDEHFDAIEFNSFEFCNVTNLKVTEKVTTSIKHNTDDSENYMVAATEMIVSALDSSKKVETVDGRLGKIMPVRGCTKYMESMTIADVYVGIGDYIHMYETKLTIVGDVTFLQSDLKNDRGELSQVFELLRIATLVVDGQLIIKNDDIRYELFSDKIEAAHYTVKNDDNTEDNYYTTLKKAIENGATSIDMNGQLIVKEDITVPAGVTVKIADIEYDEEAEDIDDTYAVIIEEEATLKIADGASYRMPVDAAESDYMIYAMKVAGAFHIENINSGITLGESKNEIFADVLLKDGTSRVYTNIYDAAAQAKSGAEIEAYNPALFEIADGRSEQAIVIDKDLIIPAGVQFSNVNTNGTATDDDDVEHYIYVENGYTLTVAGKLTMYREDCLVAGENGWNDAVSKPVKGEMKDFSVIAIGPQGVIEFQDMADELRTGLRVYLDYLVAGAYFEKDDPKEDTHYYCIANPELALNGILDTDERLVEIAGKVTLENIKVSGAEGKIAEVWLTYGYYENTEITMKNFTFAYAQIGANAGVILNGDIGTSTGKITFDDAKAGNATYSGKAAPYSGNMLFGEVFADDAYNFGIGGDLTSNKATTISGKVYASGFSYFIDTEAPDYDNITTEDIRFTIPAGSELVLKEYDRQSGADGSAYFDGELLVAGTLTISNSGSLEAMLVSVLGTLNNQKLDGVSGHAKIQVLMAGGSADSFKDFAGDCAAYKRYINGNTSIIGDGSFNLGAGFLFNGATVSAPVLKDWMESGDYGSTEFYVDGNLWMKAYVGDGVKIPFAYIYDDSVTHYCLIPALENAEFKSWQTYDEKTKTYSDVVPKTIAYYIPAVYVGQVGYEKVYANIESKIYSIEIVADIGIDNVYIDGILLLKDKTSNTYKGVLASGTHAISYTLANGYSGSAIITSIDGKELVGQGLSFTVDDDKYDDVAGKMVITISGIQKSGIDVDPETHPEETVGGLTVTEILLIVVVIIMAIMAIVLILRLNRS